MQKAVNSLRGSVRIEIEGKFPERFINLCAARNLSFWDLQRVSDSVYRASVSLRTYVRARELSEVSLCSVRCVGKNGLPFIAWKIRRRYVLIAGILLVWAALWLSSLFIWDFEIHGNENVSSEAILAALDDIGIRIGIFGPSINQEDIRSEVLLKLSDLSWITVNVSGSRAEVIVRERVKKPDMTDESVPAEIIAAKSGIITKMYVYDGRSEFHAGDTVLAGDVLVEGKIESLSTGIRYVHAKADIYARTWYELSSQIPAQCGEKQYTGEKHSKKALLFFGKRLNLYFASGISYTDCDKITSNRNVSLPGGVLSFLGTATDTYEEYEKVMRTLSSKEAENLLAPRLYDSLLRGIDGEIASSSVWSSEENGMIIVTVRAECVEQIAVAREIEE